MKSQRRDSLTVLHRLEAGFAVRAEPFDGGPAVVLVCLRVAFH